MELSKTESFLNGEKLFISNFIGVSFAALEGFEDDGIVNFDQLLLEEFEESGDIGGDFLFQIAIVSLASPGGNYFLKWDICDERINLEQVANAGLV